VDVFPNTADRKVDLFPPALDTQAPMGLYGYQPDPGTAEFPLALISPASDRTISSTLGELPRPEVRLEMNPDDAAARGVEEGDRLRLWNALGEVRIKAHLTHLMRPGTVAMPKGVWRRNTANGYTSNALSPDTLSDLGGGEVRSEKYRPGVGLAQHFPLPYCGFLQKFLRSTQLTEACPVRLGWPGHPCVQRDVLHRLTIRARFPWRERLGRPCWQFRAASLLTSRQNPGVLFGSQTR